METEQTKETEQELKGVIAGQETRQEVDQCEKDWRWHVVMRCDGFGRAETCPPCGICGGEIQRYYTLNLFLEENKAPVCDSCAEEHVPEMHALLRFFYDSDLDSLFLDMRCAQSSSTMVRRGGMIYSWPTHWSVFHDYVENKLRPALIKVLDHVKPYDLDR